MRCFQPFCVVAKFGMSRLRFHFPPLRSMPRYLRIPDSTCFLSPSGGIEGDTSVGSFFFFSVTLYPVVLSFDGSVTDACFC